MKTKVSAKGQIVLLVQIQRKLGIRPGDTLNLKIDGRHIILTPQRIRPPRNATAT
jgi:AbrB family looped-hinge helix DNA binding protein